MLDPSYTGNTLQSGYYVTWFEETFVQDFLKTLKRMLRNFFKNSNSYCKDVVITITSIQRVNSLCKISLFSES